jgi:hypothetical protein
MASPPTFNYNPNDMYQMNRAVGAPLALQHKRFIIIHPDSEERNSVIAKLQPGVSTNKIFHVDDAHPLPLIPIAREQHDIIVLNELVCDTGFNLWKEALHIRSHPQWIIGCTSINCLHHTVSTNADRLIFSSALSTLEMGFIMSCFECVGLDAQVFYTEDGAAVPNTGKVRWFTFDPWNCRMDLLDK